MSLIGMVGRRLRSLFAGGNSNELLNPVRFTFRLLVIMWSLCYATAFILSRFVWKSSLCMVSTGDGIEYRCVESDDGGLIFWIIGLLMIVYIPRILLLVLYAAIWYLTRKYAVMQDDVSSSHDSSSQSGKKQISNWILLLYVVQALVSQIMNQIYLIKKMNDRNYFDHEVSLQWQDHFQWFVRRSDLNWIFIGCFPYS